MIGTSRKRKGSDVDDNDGTPMDIDIQVDEVAERKLINGKVSKSIDQILEKEYGTEWKEEASSSKEMKMIPLIFTDKGTRGSSNGRDSERAFFDALEKINDKKGLITNFFSNSRKMFGFVFHGQKFDGEEIDFVCVTIYGLIVVECKGKTGHAHAQLKYEGACNQLKRKVPKLVASLGLPSDIPIFKVVPFPKLSLCNRRIVDEIDEIHVLFKEDLNDLKAWFRRKKFLLPENVTAPISFENYVKIATSFLKQYHSNGNMGFKNRREFKKRVLSDCSDKLKTAFTTFYTTEQAELLKVAHCEDLWITGAAGTGKTLVLKEQVKFLTELYPDNEEKKILAITYNVPINVDIKQWVKTNTKCKGKLVRVQTFSALLCHILLLLQEDPGQLSKVQRMEDDEKVEYILEQEILKRYFRSKYTNTSKYRHILVDEAQDLPGKWLALLDAMLNKNEKSDLWVFEDPFQAVRRNITRPDNTRFKKHSLTKVFRNTHNIFEAYQHCHERLRKEVISTEKSFSEKELSPPRIHHDVYGKSPEYISVESTQLKDSLVSSLKRLQREGVVFLDIAVMTCSTEVRDEITNYLETAGIKWKNAEEGIKLKYSKNKDDPPVIVDSYQRFKGLEAKVLIFFIQSGWTPRDMDIYVGFSRSFCHLIVIGTSSVIDNIKKDQRGCI